MCAARLLVAEDDPKQAELIRRYLEREGHSVLVVHDGRAAIDECRRRRDATGSPFLNSIFGTNNGFRRPVSRSHLSLAQRCRFQPIRARRAKRERSRQRRGTNARFGSRIGMRGAIPGYTSFGLSGGK